MPLAPGNRRVAQRLPMLAIGLLSAICGMWLGLVRIGWALPLPWPDQLVDHGPLMVCGFLGTLIGLERAVGYGARWGYAAPILTAAGAVWLDLAGGGVGGPILMSAGSAVVLAIFVVVARRHPQLFVFTMTAGAAAWLAGNIYWLTGTAIYRVVPWWIAFLVLTIAGERLELNRVLRPARLVRVMFVCAAVLILAGAAMAVPFGEPGVRVLGAGLVVLTWWLATHDVARRTVRQRGLTRFMAICLLTGYAWLGFGGAVAAITGSSTPGVVHDAMLHAIFLGFVMAMVFAHAPVIFPAVLGTPLNYRPAFYAHLAVLHASLVLRITGDLVDELGRWRSWGGLFNFVAILLFIFNTARSVTRSHAVAAPTA